MQIPSREKLGALGVCLVLLCWAELEEQSQEVLLRLFKKFLCWLWSWWTRECPAPLAGWVRSLRSQSLRLTQAAVIRVRCKTCGANHTLLREILEVRGSLITVSHYSGGRALWHKCVSAFPICFDVGYFLSCVRDRSRSTSFCIFLTENGSLGSYMCMCAYACVCVCVIHRGFPVGSGSKKSSLQCRRPGLDLWAGKMPWRRAWQPTWVFLPEESWRTEEPGRLQSMGSQRAGHDWVTKRTPHTHIYVCVYTCVYMYVCVCINFHRHGRRKKSATSYCDHLDLAIYNTEFLILIILNLKNDM